jgi:hypothetical protein
MRFLRNSIMKKIILFVIFLVSGIISIAQTAPSQNGPAIKLAETSHDFGDIYQGEKVSYIYAFTNIGNEPLILSEVITTCGCTAPSWDKSPVMPGESGEIQIVFNSENKMGRQNKGITILSNAINSPARVTIICNILPKKQ